MINKQELIQFVEQTWQESIVPALCEYIKIPNKSPHFDHDWHKHGFMDKAVDLIRNWCLEHAARDMKLDVIQLEGRTPIIYIDIPGNKNDELVLLYGHLDKQPEMSGWASDLGPWQPVLKGDKLYGRGGADDGYACFSALTAILALQKQNIPHARCVILIEACEESGSYDLPYYVDHIKNRLGSPSLVICLDSGCGNYDQLWCTTSLRGNITGKLTVEILTEGIHSGYASGIVADSFRITRQLLDRIEDEKTGQVLVPELNCDIPQERQLQAKYAAEVLGEYLYTEIPFVPGAKPVSDNPSELILNRTWRAALSITGAEGLPPIEQAGNVLRPKTTLKLSMRTPPNADVEEAATSMKQLLEQSPPYQAKADFVNDSNAPGWNAPPMDAWLADAIENASLVFFNKPAVYMGEGGTIPFMGMLGEKFPQAQFLITGVLGPHSNAHGPNEFLHIPTAKKLTASVAYVIAEHYLHTSGTRK